MNKKQEVSEKQIISASREDLASRDYFFLIFIDETIF
jgi:hypothetical protein